MTSTVLRRVGMCHSKVWAQIEHAHMWDSSSDLECWELLWIQDLKLGSTLMCVTWTYILIHVQISARIVRHTGHTCQKCRVYVLQRAMPEVHIVPIMPPAIRMLRAMRAMSVAFFYIVLP